MRQPVITAYEALIQDSGEMAIWATMDGYRTRTITISPEMADVVADILSGRIATLGDLANDPAIVEAAGEGR